MGFLGAVRRNWPDPHGARCSVDRKGLGDAARGQCRDRGNIPGWHYRPCAGLPRIIAALPTVRCRGSHQPLGDLRGPDTIRGRDFRSW